MLSPGAVQEVQGDGRLLPVRDGGRRRRCRVAAVVAEEGDAAGLAGASSARRLLEADVAVLVGAVVGSSVTVVDSLVSVTEAGEVAVISVLEAGASLEDTVS